MTKPTIKSGWLAFAQSRWRRATLLLLAGFLCNMAASLLSGAFSSFSTAMNICVRETPDDDPYLVLGSTSIGGTFHLVFAPPKRQQTEIISRNSGKLDLPGWSRIRGDSPLFMRNPPMAGRLLVQGIEFEEAYGWPFRSFFMFCETDALGFHYRNGVWIYAGLAKSWEVPFLSRGRGFPLAYGVIWQGVTCGTVFWAVLLGAGRATALAWIRASRRRRGLCPQCGYTLGRLARCPECGQVTSESSFQRSAKSD